jgi:PKD repeat protein
LEAGNTYPVELVPGFSSRSKFEYWAIWIDYNQDKIFDDNELVFQSSKSKSTVKGSIAIPSEIELNTRLRVAMGKSAPSACGYSDMGEIEDYSVQISKPVEQPPVADFTANVFSVELGGQVQFSDLSENKPSTWQWNFPGSDELGSNAQNPVITYSKEGTYDVSLTVSKPGFESSTELKTALITVYAKKQVAYCTPLNVNSSFDYIKNVVIAGLMENLSGADGYSVYHEILTMDAGKKYSIELTPEMDNTRNFWRVWMDINADGDFEDAGEELLTLNNKKGKVTTTITVPETVAGESRIRIAMQTGKSPSPCSDDFPGEVEDYSVQINGSLPQMAASQNITNVDPGPELKYKIYPNPVSDILTVQLSEYTTGTKISMFSTTGEKIKEFVPESNEVKLDMQQHAPGLYFIHIHDNQHSKIEKVIKR